VENERNKRIAITLGIGGLLNAILFALIEFSPDTNAAAKVLMILFGWLFISYGLWSFADVPAALRDLFVLFRSRPQRPAPSPMGVQQGHPVLASVEEIAESKTLDAEQTAALAEMVAVLARHGVFAPRIPDPALLHPSIADYGAVDPGAVFGALSELHYYHPAIPEDSFMANLAMLTSHGEQGAETLAEEIADIDRLTQGALGLADEALCWPADIRAEEAELRITINGAPTVLRWRALDKYLSTVPHVALAKTYAALGTGFRLATYWTDQGAWIMRLADGAVEALNAELGLDPATSDPFGWLDEEEPIAAGDPPPVLT
jgi:hypothetical protein